MSDDNFTDNISKIDTCISTGKYVDAMPIFKELHSKIAPNDLSIFLTLKALGEDIQNKRNEDYLLKQIEDLKTRFTLQRIPKSEKISNFTISVVSYTLIPIIPFIANWLNKEANTKKDIILSLAMYCISIALSLKHARDRIIGILFSLIVFLLVDKEPRDGAVIGTYCLSLVTVVLHISDRFSRHIVNNEPYV